MGAEFCTLSQLSNIDVGEFWQWPCPIYLCLFLPSQTGSTICRYAVLQVIHWTRGPGGQHKWGLTFSPHSICPMCPAFKLYLPPKRAHVANFQKVIVHSWNHSLTELGHFWLWKFGESMTMAFANSHKVAAWTSSCFADEPLRVQTILRTFTDLLHYLTTKGTALFWETTS